MKRADLGFALAGFVGLAAALYGAIGAPRLEWAGDAAAIVNGVPIPREALARAVLALDADSRNPVTPEREAAVLERLIEEELLVQHGVELGLAETDFAARRALVQSVLSLGDGASAPAQEPSEAELRRFYRDNAGFFAPAPRFAASIVFVREGAGRADKLAAARAALASGASARGLGDAMIIPLPAGALDAIGMAAADRPRRGGGGRALGARRGQRADRSRLAAFISSALTVSSPRPPRLSTAIEPEQFARSGTAAPTNKRRATISPA